MIPGLCGHDHEDEQDVAVCRLNRDDSHFERFLGLCFKDNALNLVRF